MPQKRKYDQRMKTLTGDRPLSGHATNNAFLFENPP